MALHLLRTALGIKDIDTLKRRQATRVAEQDGRRVVTSRTRRRPRRAEELTDGGSVYWVMKGMIRARQEIVAFIDTTDEEGRYLGLIVLDAEPVAVRPVEQKGFQGWRYLEPESAPSDHDGDVGADMPPALVAELTALGLL